MAEIEGLSHPTMVECNGIIYLTGYRDGGVYLRRSVDGGTSWQAEVQVAAQADEARAGLLKMDTQGRRLMVAVSQKPVIAVYVSIDDGETWLKEGEV